MSLSTTQICFALPSICRRGSIFCITGVWGWLIRPWKFSLNPSSFQKLVLSASHFSHETLATEEKEFATNSRQLFLTENPMLHFCVSVCLSFKLLTAVHRLQNVGLSDKEIEILTSTEHRPNYCLQVISQVLSKNTDITDFQRINMVRGRICLDCCWPDTRTFIHPPFPLSNTLFLASIYSSAMHWSSSFCIRTMHQDLWSTTTQSIGSLASMTGLIAGFCERVRIPPPALLNVALINQGACSIALRPQGECEESLKKNTLLKNEYASKCRPWVCIGFDGWSVCLQLPFSLFVELTLLCGNTDTALWWYK